MHNHTWYSHARLGRLRPARSGPRRCRRKNPNVRKQAAAFAVVVAVRPRPLHARRAHMFSTESNWLQMKVITTDSNQLSKHAGAGVSWADLPADPAA